MIKQLKFLRIMILFFSNTMNASKGQKICIPPLSSRHFITFTFFVMLQNTNFPRFNVVFANYVI